MKTKHTSIPWKIDPQDRGVIIDSKNRDIAVMSIHTAMKNRSIESLDEKIIEANARWICQCVNNYNDLLKACQNFIKRYGKTIPTRIENEYLVIKQAIKKATGEEYE